MKQFTSCLGEHVKPSASQKPSIQPETLNPARNPQLDSNVRRHHLSYRNGTCCLYNAYNTLPASYAPHLILCDEWSLGNGTKNLIDIGISNTTGIGIIVESDIAKRGKNTLYVHAGEDVSNPSLKDPMPQARTIGPERTCIINPAGTWGGRSAHSPLNRGSTSELVRPEPSEPLRCGALPGRQTFESRARPAEVPDGLARPPGLAYRARRHSPTSHANYAISISL
ncbi:hypothetical protein EVAR_33331_1 [Eumeta japonica]|uniref:Uncharacterized protein n=1 Tax=Eumeta variegata TaxID=151549 RepID=A0A4C1YLS0_EUMVA|nr:hypothetical protein EVAR_33331_1 [Eumeta japonica]